MSSSRSGCLESCHQFIAARLEIARQPTSLPAAAGLRPIAGPGCKPGSDQILARSREGLAPASGPAASADRRQAGSSDEARLRAQASCTRSRHACRAHLIEHDALFAAGAGPAWAASGLRDRPALRASELDRRQRSFMATGSAASAAASRRTGSGGEAADHAATLPCAEEGIPRRIPSLAMSFSVGTAAGATSSLNISWRMRSAERCCKPPAMADAGGKPGLVRRALTDSARGSGRSAECAGSLPGCAATGCRQT